MLCLLRVAEQENESSFFVTSWRSGLRRELSQAEHA